MSVDCCPPINALVAMLNGQRLNVAHASSKYVHLSADNRQRTSGRDAQPRLERSTAVMTLGSEHPGGLDAATALVSFIATSPAMAKCWINLRHFERSTIPRTTHDIGESTEPRSTRTSFSCELLDGALAGNAAGSAQTAVRRSLCSKKGTLSILTRLSKLVFVRPSGQIELYLLSRPQ